MATSSPSCCRGCTPETAAARAAALVGVGRAAPRWSLPGVGSLALTVSVGVAHAPTHADDLRSLYAAADEALYSAKRAGRDGYAVAPSPRVPPRRPGAPAAGGRRSPAGVTVRHRGTRSVVGTLSAGRAT